jgi:hypothetical protein
LPRFESEYAKLKGYLASPAADAEGLMTVDSVDGELSHHYGLTWKRCDDGGQGQCDNLPPTQTFGDGHPHNLVLLMQQKLQAQGAPQHLMPTQPLQRTTNGRGGGNRWDENSGTVDQQTLDNFCNVMGYQTAIASTCHDQEQSRRYPGGKCNFHSPNNNEFSVFNGNGFQTLRGPHKYKSTWAATITCSQPINSCN